MRALSADDAICVAVHRMRSCGFPSLNVDERPDTPGRPHNDGKIDAVAGLFAIEHTSVDWLPDGRTHNAAFDRVIHGIERDYADKFTPALCLSMRFGAIPLGKGVVWSQIGIALRAWLDGDASRLSEETRQTLAIQGVPFSLEASRTHRLGTSGVYFRRVASEEPERGLRWRQRFDLKLKKLGEHRSSRPNDKHKLVLLVQSGFEQFV
jgi:hypothetical protein